VQIVALLVILAVVIRLLTSDERKRAVGRFVDFGKQLNAARARIRPCEPLRTNLRERTPRLLVTPALAAAMVAATAIGSADGLGNLGPQTTAGEWWRLLTATFVQPGLLALVINLVAFIQPAALLERMLGHAALAVVYVAMSLIAGAFQLAANPVGVNVGAVPVMVGIYALLIVVIGAGYIWRSPLTVPLLAIKRMLPGFVLFLAYIVAAHGYTGADDAAFLTGLISGAVFAYGLVERKPPVARVAGLAAAAVVVAVGVAVSIGDIIDARPEFENVLALERRTADAYNAAVERFRQGHLKTDALVKLIEQSIVPELKAAEKRVTALHSVANEQQPLVTHAEEYLRLRSESWRLRSEGLRTTNMLRLRQADRTERASLGALDHLKPKTEPVKPAPEPAEPTTETAKAATKQAKPTKATTKPTRPADPK
jgi:membrane associated rhomboid family serine protease